MHNSHLRRTKKSPHARVVGDEEELYPQVVWMGLLESGGVGVRVSNDVVNVAIIDQDVTEPAVNMGDVCSRKTVDAFCAWVILLILILLKSKRHNFLSNPGATREKKTLALCFILYLMRCNWIFAIGS